MKNYISILFVAVMGLCFSSLMGEELSKAKVPDLLPMVILGSGPAGLAAAQYSVRLGMPTTLFMGQTSGGLLTKTSFIDNYPGVMKVAGDIFMDTMIEQTRQAGVKILDETIVSVDLSQWPFVIGTEEGIMYRVLSLVIATGATPKMLNVPGEETHYGNGVSSCALCDGLFFKGKDVFVIGGGDSAVEEALQLAPHVKSVTCLVRRQHMRAAHSMQQKLQGYPTIKPPRYGVQVKSILGNNEGVTGIEIQNFETNKTEVLDADGVFLAIGHHPNTDLFVGQLALSENGHILVEGRTQATSVPGVFAAGDVEDDIYRQAIVAAGRGAAAAIDAVSWLRKQGVTEDALKQLAS